MVRITLYLQVLCATDSFWKVVIIRCFDRSARRWSPSIRRSGLRTSFCFVYPGHFVENGSVAVRAIRLRSLLGRSPVKIHDGTPVSQEDNAPPPSQTLHLLHRNPTLLHLNYPLFTPLSLGYVLPLDKRTFLNLINTHLPLRAQRL